MPPTTLVLSFEKHEIRVSSPERFDTVTVLADPVPTDIPKIAKWQVSVAPKGASTAAHAAASVTIEPDGGSNQEGESPAALIHPIFTPRSPSEEVISDHDDKEPNDSEDGNLSSGSETDTSLPPSPPASSRGMKLAGIGDFMMYTAAMYRSSTLSIAQSILEVTYRATGRLAWSRFHARVGMSKDQSERSEKEAMVSLLASRISKSGLITESFPPEGSRRVWLVPLDLTDTQGTYAVIAKSRGRKLRAALKETFDVQLHRGKRGIQHDHFLAEILARSLWWLSAKPVEIVMLPKPLCQTEYWIEDYKWANVKTLIAECNEELGTSIALCTYEQFMEVLNQKK
eukprot:Blabericola_migrator_1__12538@NODE_796_length_6480_cov_171_808046_g564_i0_p3_GENE_NODE_796_length_6480_cov_171_808046_g564_i0NODE_796_length_6480_cov_171_808046_g564_i0_p3_ORF_typecomplete_len342_score63_12_NODE_796_length_6480_cov_171_808046_g564_i07631788